jgi:hypothetical protein
MLIPATAPDTKPPTQNAVRQRASWPTSPLTGSIIKPPMMAQIETNRTPPNRDFCTVNRAIHGIETRSITGMTNTNMKRTPTYAPKMNPRNPERTPSTTHDPMTQVATEIAAIHAKCRSTFPPNEYAQRRPTRPALRRGRAVLPCSPHRILPAFRASSHRALDHLPTRAGYRMHVDIMSAGKEWGQGGGQGVSTARQRDRAAIG